jgi:flagellar P-ring protein precursor FlgI
MKKRTIYTFAITIIWLIIAVMAFGQTDNPNSDSSSDKSFLLENTTIEPDVSTKQKEKTKEGLIVPGTVKSRIKDIARIDGVRKNQLFGIGLVTGLAGTGDDTNSVKFTAQAIANMLDNLGIKADPKDIRVKNFASVMVTADLPPFVKPGDTIDITISSMGNAKSLEGGTLVLTPLQAADGEIYAVAQGAISLGGFGAESAGGGAKVAKNYLTVGRIPAGAIVEKEVHFEFENDGQIVWVLREPDFTTAYLMVEAIKKAFPMAMAKAFDPSSVLVRIPSEFRYDPTEFIARVEQIEVAVDGSSKVVINEKNGTIVLGGNVRILPVSIAHGAITVVISDTLEVSQPQPFSSGKTVVTQKEEMAVTEKPAQFVQVTSETLVNALNQLGASAKDIVAIFQAIKAAGALQAELVII